MVRPGARGGPPAPSIRCAVAGAELDRQDVVLAHYPDHLVALADDGGAELVLPTTGARAQVGRSLGHWWLEILFFPLTLVLADVAEWSPVRWPRRPSRTWFARIEAGGRRFRLENLALEDAQAVLRLTRDPEWPRG